jgi:predicted nucleic acid-binding protein
VTLVIDAAPIVALAESNEPRRQAILDLMEAEPGDLLIPSPVTAEIDYLLGQRFGGKARSAFLRDLGAGRFTGPCLEREDYTSIRDLDTRYADLELGLADCALVVIANRYETSRIVSFDERHFRAVTPLRGGAFTILPADG